MFHIITEAEKLRDDLMIVFTMHEDEDVDAFGKGTKKPKMIGKMLDEKFDLAGAFETILYSTVEFDEDGEAQYKFITKRTEEYPAKSPMGMFESTKVDNDLKEIITEMNQYFNSAQ